MSTDNRDSISMNKISGWLARVLRLSAIIPHHLESFLTATHCAYRAHAVAAPLYALQTRSHSFDFVHFDRRDVDVPVGMIF